MMVQFVATGAVTLAKGKPGLGVQWLNEDGTLAGSTYFDRKSKVVGSARVGCVYEVRREDSIIYGPIKYVRRWEGPEVTTWKVEHDLQMAEEDAAKVRAKGEKHAAAEAMEGLAPMREIMRKSLSVRRRALAALVLDYLYS